MIVVRTIVELRDAVAAMPRPVGFVPTMGALHAGHISLLDHSRDQNPSTVLSIFVNPTQFGPNEDLTRYPRPIEKDLALAEAAGTTIVFLPEVETMYPTGYATAVTVKGLSEYWEGAERPGHFDGVSTVVARLLNLVGADRAYFGEKDYQQLQIVRRMTADLAIRTEIVGCPIIRDDDGLALSSRNIYITDTAMRNTALALPKALALAKAMVKSGERKAKVISAHMRTFAENSGLQVDYLEIVAPTTLEPLNLISDEARAIGAVRLPTVRLIDNVALVPEAR